MASVRHILIEVSSTATDEEKAAWKEAGLASWPAIMPELRGDAAGYLEAIQSAKKECAQ